MNVLSSLIKNIERQNSLKTTDTKLPILDYDFSEIKRFNELNHSLSDISEFEPMIRLSLRGTTFIYCGSVPWVYPVKPWLLRY